MPGGFSALTHGPISRVETKRANVLRAVIKQSLNKTENHNQFSIQIETPESLCEAEQFRVAGIDRKRDRSRAVFLWPGSRLGRVSANPATTPRSQLATVRFRQFFQLPPARLFAGVMGQWTPASKCLSYLIRQFLKASAVVDRKRLSSLPQGQKMRRQAQTRSKESCSRGFNR